MSSTADDGKPCPGCARDLVNGECQTDGCPGPATEADDTSASSLMGGNTDTQPTEPQGEVFDPAEESDPHRDGMMQRVRAPLQVPPCRPGRPESVHDEAQGRDGAVRRRCSWGRRGVVLPRRYRARRRTA